MKQLKDKTYSIRENQWIKDVLKTIPTNIILWKKLCGIGATALELDTSRHSIVAEANVPVIKGKCKKYNTTRAKKILGVYEGVTVDEIIEYLESPVQWKKILVTPESFGKVKDAMQELGIDMYGTYFLLIDECERTIQDIGYRANITLPMKDFFTFKGKAFISATPIIPSDPRFAQYKFSNVYIEPAKDYDYKQKLHVIETNNVMLSLKKFITENKRKQYFVFFNSTDTIAHFLNELEVKDQSAIFCAKESMQKLKVNNFTHVSTSLGEFRIYNWMTSRFFSAVDIDGIVDPTIIMITDLISAQHSMIDPLSEAIQIVGRFRKPKVGQIKKEVVHITNFLPGLISMSELEVLEYINECQIVYRVLKRYLKASTTRGAVSTLKEILKRIEFAKYINEDGSRNYFMQDNTVFEEELKGYYQCLQNLLNAYEESKRFVVSHHSEVYDITDKERALKQNTTPLKTVYSVLMPMLKDIYDSEKTTVFQREFQMAFLRKEFKKVVQDFDRLGYETVKALDFNPKKIKAAVKEKDKSEQESNFGLMQYIEEAFKEGELCSSQKITARLTHGIRENKLPMLKPNVKLLKKYCQLSERMWIGKNGDKDVMGYRVLKIYDKLKN
ncbi:hypothetical protein [Mucilaginibacter sp. CSA2-8R]|uniref:hypothetical protein n=1 Tax=Mucilaginibacter sp. CSA2-8R TaxID=3141542 RepID=UPI00315DE42C